jgi:hypothetical protein
MEPTRRTYRSATGTRVTSQRLRRPGPLAFFVSASLPVAAPEEASASAGSCLRACFDGGRQGGRVHRDFQRKPGLRCQRDQFCGKVAGLEDYVWVPLNAEIQDSPLHAGYCPQPPDGPHPLPKKPDGVPYLALVVRPFPSTYENVAPGPLVSAKQLGASRRLRLTASVDLHGFEWSPTQVLVHVEVTAAYPEDTGHRGVSPCAPLPSAQHLVAGERVSN